MNAAPASPQPTFGLVAEFDSADALVAAARQAYGQGYRQMNGYSPFPIEELWEALGHHHSRLPWIVLGGGIAGFLGGFGLQYWVSVIAYPLNIGGRPLNSWPAFIPVTFETTVLLAALAAVFGMLALNGLPRPHHPVFNAPRFDRVTRDGYFLCIRAEDRMFDRAATERFLRGLSAVEVSEVEH
jgi:hypothetical protein